MKARWSRRLLALALALGLALPAGLTEALAADVSRAPTAPTTLALPTLPVSPFAAIAIDEALAADPPQLEPPAAPLAAPAIAAAVHGAPVAATEAPGAAHAAAPSADEEAARGRAVFDNAATSRLVTFVYDAGDRTDVENVHLTGNFDKRSGAYDDSAWSRLLPMTHAGDGRWTATVALRDDGQTRDWRWGTVVDLKDRPRQWGVMEEAPLPLALDRNTTPQTASYAPTTFHSMGAVRSGANDASFRVWAPNAHHVDVKLTNPRTKAETIHALTRGEDGVWSTTLPSAWKALQGSAYVYRITASDGRILQRADPYARVMQGKQRGITTIYVDAETAEPAQPFHFLADKRAQTPLTRFEIQERVNEPLAKAFVVLKGADGRALTKAQLLARLGSGNAKLAGAFGPSYWADSMEPDGRVRLQRHDGAWAAVFDHPEKLLGLRYELQAFTADGRPASNKNDAWSDLIEPSSGKSFRGAVVSEDNFSWHSDAAARERNHAKWRFYELHAGSFMGRDGNLRRSTFDDVRRELGYIKWLGFNAVELLPTGESEDLREWGYTGANSLAVESNYGFEDENGRWITGLEALQRLVDEAHRLGLDVVGDVVYNHIGGKYGADWQVSAIDGSDHHLWQFDGPENPYFNWNPTAPRPETRGTPWGPLPAYNGGKARQFFLDHLGYQAQKLHLDGLRFDFTDPIKGEGGAAGWGLLRQMNRLARFINARFFTAAEQFPYDWTMTEPQKPNGSFAGFDAQWYTEFNHRLVHEQDASKPSILQEAAAGAKTTMDRFMDMLLDHAGIKRWSAAVTPITNHDEVGNGDRVIGIAAGRATGPWSQFARDASRFSLGMGLMSPGMPMIFQGEESLADNTFQWGNPHTWDVGTDEWRALGPDWDWSQIRFNDARKALYEKLADMPAAQRATQSDFKALTQPERALVAHVEEIVAAKRPETWRNVARRQAAEFTRAVNALRASSDAFDADAPAERVYTHNDHSIVAFTRKKGDDEYLIVGTLHRDAWKDYGLQLPSGPWTEVFTSDAERFGGSGVSNTAKPFAGGWSHIDIPAAGFVVFKKAR